MAMIGLGIAFTCMAGAARGNHIAYGLSVSLLGLMIAAIIAAITYWALYGLAIMTTSVVSRNDDDHTLVTADNPSFSGDANAESKLNNNPVGETQS